SASSMQESVQRAVPSLPSTPIPPVLSNASAEEESPQPAFQEAETEEEQPDLAEGAREKPLDGTSVEHGIPPASAPEDLELPMEEAGAEPVAPHPPFSVTITVLKELNLTLYAPGGKRSRVPLHLNTKETQLIAYLAWLHGQSQGQTISLDKLREHIFGYGKAD